MSYYKLHKFYQKNVIKSKAVRKRRRWRQSDDDRNKLKLKVNDTLQTDVIVCFIDEAILSQQYCQRLG